MNSDMMIAKIQLSNAIVFFTPRQAKKNITHRNKNIHKNQNQNHFGVNFLPKKVNVFSYHLIL